MLFKKVAWALVPLAFSGLTTALRPADKPLYPRQNKTTPESSTPAAALFKGEATPANNACPDTYNNPKPITVTVVSYVTVVSTTTTTTTKTTTSVSTTTTTTTSVSTTTKTTTSVSTTTTTSVSTTTTTKTITSFQTTEHVSTLTTSYPYTVVVTVGCTVCASIPKRTAAPDPDVRIVLRKRTNNLQCCSVVTSTIWRTVTATKTIATPTTVWTTTTIHDTKTITTSYPVTVTKDVTSWTTTTTTVVSTITTSYPVTTTVKETETKISISIVPTTLVTTVVSSFTTTFTTTSLVPITVISSSTIFSTMTITTTAVVTTTTPVTITQFNTVTLPPVTNLITQPPVTNVVTQLVTTVLTSTLPPLTTVLTLPGTVITTVLPASTVLITSVITLPPVTLPPVTVTTSIVQAITTCPAPIQTIVAAVPSAAPTGTTLWGCPAGFICNPPKPVGCNLFEDAPDYTFNCDSQYCVKAPDLLITRWPANGTSFFPNQNGYYNLAPPAFGLSYDIFQAVIVVEQVNGVLQTITTGNWVSQSTLSHFGTDSTAVTTAAPAYTSKPGGKLYYATTYTLGVEHFARRDEGFHLHYLGKRDDTIVPAVCYDECNQCFLEAQKTGKSPALCSLTATFMLYYQSCQLCINDNAGTNKDLVQRTYLEPKFQPFVSYCNALAPQAAVLPASTITIVQPAVTSAAPPPSSAPQAPVNTVTSVVVVAVTSTSVATPPAPVPSTSSPPPAPEPTTSSPPAPSSSSPPPPAPPAESPTSPAETSSVIVVVPPPPATTSTTSPATVATTTGPPRVTVSLGQRLQATWAMLLIPFAAALLFA